MTINSNTQSFTSLNGAIKVTQISQLDSNSSCGCSINVDNYSPQEIAVIDDNNKNYICQQSYKAT